MKINAKNIFAAAAILMYISVIITTAAYFSNDSIKIVCP
jgi:hypothetical protein